MQKIITEGNRSVVINQHTPGVVSATLYVNARVGLADATITTQRWTGKSITGAERWARQQLGGGVPMRNMRDLDKVMDW